MPTSLVTLGGSLNEESIFLGLEGAEGIFGEASLFDMFMLSGLVGVSLSKDGGIVRTSLPKPGAASTFKVEKKDTEK